MLFSDYDGSLLRRQLRATHVLATIVFREKVATADPEEACLVSQCLPLLGT